MLGSDARKGCSEAMLGRDARKGYLLSLVRGLCNTWLLLGWKGIEWEDGRVYRIGFSGEKGEVF